MSAEDKLGGYASGFGSLDANAIAFSRKVICQDTLQS